jgi:MFS family permease
MPISGVDEYIQPSFPLSQMGNIKEQEKRSGLSPERDENDIIQLIRAQAEQCTRSEEYYNLHLDLQIPDSEGLKLHKQPISWSRSRKTCVLTPPFLAALLAAYSAGAYSLIADDLRALWNLSDVYFNLGITIFVLGFGFAPIILALISELYGRYWVFIGSGIVFFLGTMGCAITDSFGGMLACRLITGSGASVFATLTGGVVGDLFPKAERNTPMTLYSTCIIMGTGIGPLVSGAIVQYLSWRWVFYAQMILVGTATLALALVFEETRANVLLARNCQILNAFMEKFENGSTVAPLARGESKSTHDGEMQPRLESIRFRPLDGSNISIASNIWRSFKFPLELLATDSIVFWFSAWVSFAWAILYMQFSSIGLVYRKIYLFNNQQIGAVYVAVIVGAFLGAVTSIIHDKISRKYRPQASARPESRLYLACAATWFLPIGLFWFGWTSSKEIHWIVPTAAISVFIAGIFVIYLAVFNYLADAYTFNASSALAAQSMCRNLLAGAFPLFNASMFARLGYGVAGSLLGGIAALLCCVPWIFCWKGDAIRKRSPYLRKLENI